LTIRFTPDTDSQDGRRRPSCALVPPLVRGGSGIVRITRQYSVFKDRARQQRAP
jgi:hypothetical protein